MSRHLPQAPHYEVCLQMLTLATKAAQCFDVLDDRSLASPQATGRIARQVTAVTSLAEDAAAVGTAHLGLPMSLIDHTDHTVASRLAQLPVVAKAAAEALRSAAESTDPVSMTAADTRLTHVQAARDLLATAASDLLACAERVAAEMERYRNNYAVPEAHHQMTAAQFKALKLITTRVVSIDEDGRPWVGMDKTAVHPSAIRALDQQGLIEPVPCASWAEEIRVLPSPMGRLVLAATLGRPEHPAAEAPSVPSPLPAGPVASAARARR
ncbi:hypothetical protein ACFCWY_15165 [Streptomyces sp. NPDC056362]|uniref:hypothetical protein n=1 Tax=unclassified Streptomyces TaxID=2593676 RepID=UPI0035DB3BC3